MRTPADLSEQLKRQIGYLERSAAAFDAGAEDEAQRLAVTLRVLFHDTHKSTSLMTLLGRKHGLLMVDTGFYRDRMDAARDAWCAANLPGYSSDNFSTAIQPGEAGLVVLKQFGTQFRWCAPLGERPIPIHYRAALIERQPFDQWWTSPLVETSKMTYFNRRKLVLIMANQDGGAHVDHRLDSEYVDLTVDYLGVGVSILDGPVDIQTAPIPPPVQGNVAAASIRQIAYEALATLT